jgi:hypothetical protein
VEGLSKSIGLKPVADSAVIKGAPEGDTAQDCRALGLKLAEALK